MNIKNIISEIHKKLYWIKKYGRYLGFTKKCPVCNHYQREFSPAGIKRRKNARCIWCGSMERHRLIWLFFKRKTNLFDGQPKKMLHFAPEKAFLTPLLNSIGSGYITVDLYNDAMVKMDITNLSFPEDTFDVIYCSHVLEHIVKDVQAIKELARVLTKEGWALILVPINAEKTYEDKNIIKPEDRLRVFGQEDHVRICGYDYKQRLENNGFIVNEVKPKNIANKNEMEYFGLKDDILYYCTKKSLIS